MKRVGFGAWASLSLLGVMVGCSESDAPAIGGAMMNGDPAMMEGDGAMMNGDAMKGDEKMMKDGGE